MPLQLSRPDPRGDRDGAVAPKTTVLTLQEKRRQGQPITTLTAHDYPTARALEAAGVDAILVGDSLAMVALGHPDTLSVTMDEMLHHARAVSRGAKTPLLVGDMPFMSYQASSDDAVRNAGRFLQEAGMDAVKLEGGRPFADTVRAIVRAGIPVQGHIGLRPQSVKELGGFRVQGRTAGAARGLLEDAHALEDAGCFSIVLEAVPERLATYITEQVQVPTIGIGAGAGTSGQVLVTADVLGLYDALAPRFARRYANLGETIAGALRAFREDVEARAFPARDHAYAMPSDEWDAFVAGLPTRRAAAAR
ncbi:MAG TPA: 3-methyl-2-oxobutanoate hydroxymethyltransferase [Vicinamibacteria bacterium]